MSRVDDVGERDGWRCWVCDERVDPQMSVNDPRGPSVDSITTKSKSKGAKHQPDGPPEERLAHRGCNTRKGAVTPVVPWPQHLFVVDPAPIIETVDALRRKGGRTVVARCPTREDGDAAAEWLTDRIARLTPGFTVRAGVEPAGSQYMLVLSVS